MGSAPSAHGGGSRAGLGTAASTGCVPGTDGGARRSAAGGGGAAAVSAALRREKGAPAEPGPAEGPRAVRVRRRGRREDPAGLVLAWGALGCAALGP